MLVDLTERDLAVDVGSEPLLSVLLLEGLLPVGGGELEDALRGPARDEAEQVAQVGGGLELVELAAREQRDEGRVHLAAVVAPQEQPVLSSDGFAAQLALAEIVVDRQATVLEETRERRPLVARVADGLRRRGLVEHAVGLGITPGEELLDDGGRFALAHGEPLLGWCGRVQPLQAKERADE